MHSYFHKLWDRAGEVANSWLLWEGSSPCAAAIFRAGSWCLRERRGEEWEESATAPSTAGNQQSPQRREITGRPETTGNASVCAGIHVYMQRGEALLYALSNSQVSIRSCWRMALWNYFTGVWWSSTWTQLRSFNLTSINSAWAWSSTGSWRLRFVNADTSICVSGLVIS